MSKSPFVPPQMQNGESAFDQDFPRDSIEGGKEFVRDQQSNASAPLLLSVLGVSVLLVPSGTMCPPDFMGGGPFPSGLGALGGKGLLDANDVTLLSEMLDK